MKTENFQPFLVGKDELMLTLLVALFEAILQVIPNPFKSYLGPLILH